MASESAFWDTLRDLIGKEGHVKRCENYVGPGTPDVNYCIRGVERWIELKEVDGWPKRLDTKFDIEHFTSDQRIWHRRRWAAGGISYVFVQIGRDYFLFSGLWAAKYIGTMDSLHTANGALAVWRGSMNKTELLGWLTLPSQNFSR
jgi:hypothetical protein